MTDHLHRGTELFVPRFTVITVSAGNVVVQANPFTGFKARYIRADPFHLASHFMSERDGQHSHSRSSGAVVGIRVTDPGGADPHQHILLTGSRNGKLLQFQRFPWLDHADRFHMVSPLIFRAERSYERSPSSTTEARIL
jgi:hypothetical protein